ncbi:MAG: hypothetical protein IT453_15135 [Planctomycetes bacterium]|nr:hypothetical protein [Planctomycetota bacterium]
MLKKLLLSSALLSLPLVCLAPLGAAQDDSPAVPHGHAKGLFALPSQNGHGAMAGFLLAPDGTKLLALDAATGFGQPGNGKGPIHGELRDATTDVVVAEVVGKWHYSPALQKGAYELRFLGADDGDPTTPRPVLGKLDGHFGDPNGPLPPLGKFVGLWKLDLP